MFPFCRMGDHFKMCHFVQFIFKETKITIIHKQPEWETTIKIKAHTCILGNALSLFLPFLCSTMMAIPGLHSLYTNRVNTFWRPYPVYNQMFLSSPLMLLCGFCWAVFKWRKQEESWGVGWIGVEGEGCLFLWVVPLLGQFVREPFSSSPHCKV